MFSFGDHFNFHTTNHAPYYIVSPNFIQKSAGPRTLHYLCHTLNELGYEAYITSEICNPWLRTPKLTQEIKETHKKTGRIMRAELNAWDIKDFSSCIVKT